MSATIWPAANDQGSTSPSADFASDYRQRRALEERDRAELKRADVAAQTSPLSSAELRIRAWEKVHRLRMPSNADHPVLVAIATATQLTLEDIWNEQRLRAARRAPEGPKS